LTGTIKSDIMEKLICPHCKEVLHLKVELTGDIGCCRQEYCYCTYPHVVVYALHTKESKCEFKTEILEQVSKPAKRWSVVETYHPHLASDEDDLDRILNSEENIFATRLNSLYVGWMRKRKV
jgi:hypothetical protein